MTIEYDQLEANDANFVALTPLSFLQRTADIYPQRESLIYNQRRYTWAQTRNRCTRIASSLAARGIGKNDTVSVFAFNTPEMFESHFSIPMAGAVLNTINTRLDAATVAYIIDHGESRLFICDRQLWPVLEEALQSCTIEPEIVIIDDADAVEKPALPTGIEFSFYEDLVDRGDDTFAWRAPDSEWQALTLSYTSGTTGHPGHRHFLGPAAAPTLPLYRADVSLQRLGARLDHDRARRQRGLHTRLRAQTVF
jgi:fatty-acyl-CoA synthase